MSNNEISQGYLFLGWLDKYVADNQGDQVREW
jgi:hypothetical protein